MHTDVYAILNTMVAKKDTSTIAWAVHWPLVRYMHYDPHGWPFVGCHDWPLLS